MTEPTTTPVLSPAPHRTPMIDRQTLLATRPWIVWWENSWRRQGGAEAPSNADLATDLAATQGELDATQDDLAATQEALAQTQTDLSGTQGDLATTQAALAATQADLAAKLPDGTPLSVPRYQADGSGVESTPGLLTTSDGRLGIGAEPESATVALQTSGLLVGVRDGGTMSMTMRSFGGTRCVLTGVAAPGTVAGPGATTPAQQLLRLEGRGHDGAQVSTAGRLLIDFQPTETFTSTAQGTRLVISTTLTGTLTTAERLRIDGNGFVGLGGITPTARLDVNGDTIRLRTAKTPASATAAGNTGDMAWDTGFVYVCVGAATWKRAPLTTW